jgi:hypothetical protein
MSVIDRLILAVQRFMRSDMKRIFLPAAALLLSIGTASTYTTQALASTTQLWAKGFDNFSEPLDFIRSNITWSVSSTRQLTVTFKLVGARPSKLYQVGIHIMDCSTYPKTFGQFPFRGGPAICPAITRQGVTDTVAAVEFGVVTTDVNGNGSFSVVVGPINPGTYLLEFNARDGAGCNLTGGAGNGSDCAVDFQSPGPFGTETKIIIPSPTPIPIRTRTATPTLTPTRKPTPSPTRKPSAVRLPNLGRPWIELSRDRAALQWLDEPEFSKQKEHLVKLFGIKL